MTAQARSWLGWIAVVLMLLASSTASATTGFLSGNSPLGENRLEGGVHQVSLTISAETHRGCGEGSLQDAAGLFVAPNTTGSGTLQTLQQMEAQQIAAAEGLAAREAGIQAMAMSRADALRRLNGLAPQVEAHLAKIAQNPGHSSIAHWTREVNSWLTQMEAVIPNVGTRTGADWAARIAAWRAALGG